MAQRISRTKKILVVAAVGALTLGGAGAAFAYWTSTGEGEGEAVTGASVAFTFDVEVADGDLSPGSDGQTVAFTVSNPGEGSQLLGEVLVYLATPDDTDNGLPWVPPVGCAFADYAAAITVQPTQGELAAGATTAVGGVATVTLANTAVNQDACQGADVPLLFVATSTPLPL